MNFLNRLSLLFLLWASPLFSKEWIEQTGDILAYGMPVAAFSTTFIVDDEAGRLQFYKSFGSSLALTYALKLTVQRERPDGSDNRSFPSGHSSSAFQSAVFIHLRYGLKYGALAYAGALFTAYSRVEAQKHYVSDVIAGAAIGALSSWYFTTHFKNVTLTPRISSTEGYGLKLAWRF